MESRDLRVPRMLRQGKLWMGSAGEKGKTETNEHLETLGRCAICCLVVYVIVGASGKRSSSTMLFLCHHKKKSRCYKSAMEFEGKLRRRFRKMENTRVTT